MVYQVDPYLNPQEWPRETLGHPGAIRNQDMHALEVGYA